MKLSEFRTLVRKEILEATRAGAFNADSNKLHDLLDNLTQRHGSEWVKSMLAAWSPPKVAGGFVGSGGIRLPVKDSVQEQNDDWSPEISQETKDAYKAWRTAAERGYGKTGRGSSTPDLMQKVDDRIRRLKEKFEKLLKRDKTP